MDIKDLKKWRSDHKITQKKLGELLGVTVLTVARWETGVRKIPSFLHLALKELERDLKTTGKIKKKGGESDYGR